MDLFRVVVCSVVLAVSLYIIVFRPEDQRAREFAFGAVGTILGYLLGTSVN